MTHHDQRLERRIKTLEELFALHQRALEDVAELMTTLHERQEAQEALSKTPFTTDELLAIAESFHDAVKDFPNDQLYVSIEAKADYLLASAQAAKERNTRS